MCGNLMDCKIAVLIPTKNRKELLERALNSIFVQERLPEEVVVVNDGSVDGTEEFLLFFQTNIKMLNGRL